MKLLGGYKFGVAACLASWGPQVDHLTSLVISLNVFHPSKQNTRSAHADFRARASCVAPSQCTIESETSSVESVTSMYGLAAPAVLYRIYIAQEGWDALADNAKFRFTFDDIAFLKKDYK